MCEPLIAIIHNVQNITSSHDSTYKTDIDTRLMEAGMPQSCMIRTFLWAGHGTCVPAKIIARLGPGTLLAELRGPGTAFRPTLTPGFMDA